VKCGSEVPTFSQTEKVDWIREKARNRPCKLVLMKEVGGRKIIHFNVTEHPTSAWVVQQLREASPIGSEDEQANPTPKP